MTDEEVAQDYATTECCHSCTSSCDKNKCSMFCNVRNAVLYGMEEGRKDVTYMKAEEYDEYLEVCRENAELKKNILVWHKVADDDYPPCEQGNCTVNVLTDCGDIAYYNYDDDCWVVEPSSAEIDPPVAWCEIPKYTKENE